MFIWHRIRLTWVRLFNRLSLPAKLTLTVIISMLIAALSMGYQIARQTALSAQDALAAEYEQQMAVLAVAVTPALIADAASQTADPIRLRAVLESFRSSPAVMRVGFRDTSDMETLGKDIVEPLKAPQWFVKWCDLADITGIQPLQIDGRYYGILLLNISSNPAINSAWNRYLQQVQALFEALMLITLGIWWVLRVGLRPLQTLKAGYAKLGSGDLSTRLTERGSPELRASIAGFNQMATQLEVGREELRTSKERMALATNAANMGIWDWDVVNDVLVWDDSMYLLYGIVREKFGGAYEAWAETVAPDDIERVGNDIEAALRGDQEYITEFKVCWPDGSVHFISAAGKVFRDEAGRPTRMVGINYDITERKLAEQTIWQHANFDLLTALPNRQMLYDRLDQDIRKANRAGRPLALMFLDLDHFKEVNDTLGHDIGDALLKDAALRLVSCVRESDTVARLGGDEFTIILGELEDSGSVERVAQDILLKLSEPFRLGDEVAYVSASIGITLFPEDAREIDTLLKNADQAMYAAKNMGRNRYSYFTPSMQIAAQVRMQIANDLRGALAGRQFWIAYQPIVELATGDIHKAEALLRWQHPIRGLINPVEFIPIAEDTGLIHNIGDWVFRETAHQVKRWRKSLHPAFQISVNKSPVQFHSEERTHLAWYDYLNQLGLPGQSITVEITEGLLLEASTLVVSRLLEFRDAGIQISLDDFGTGYSALSYLNKFDIDYIKIDQSFTRNLTPSFDDMALCEAIIVMAHKLGIKVIAEGVETEEQKNLLMAAGCDYAQGYLFSKPMPADEFESFYKEFNR